MYPRTIQSTIKKHLFKGKVIAIYGARRVGKTILSRKLIADFGEQGRYVNCEIHQNKQALETTNTALLKDFLGDSKIVVLDEAQSIQDIGLILKVLVDTWPDIQIIATGSSAFDIAQKIGEPLLGRSRRFTLYPLSYTEITQATDALHAKAKLENMLRFGMYPEVFDKSESESKEELMDISMHTLYKDILQFNQLKRSDLLANLLQALALQVGNQVSYTELANLLGENHHTIKNYIELLEQCFVIFRLRSFSRNLRKELSKSFKVYFFDLGVRNSLINNYNALSVRNDTGAMWENFCIVERMKRNHNARYFPNIYFWRTYDQKEVDYIEEIDGQLHAFEFKWNPRAKVKPPKDFISTYKKSTFTVIDQESFRDFVKPL